MENNNKSQAELYREERKERLAKAAAKNAKKSPMSIKAQQAAKKVISIVLAVVIAFGAFAGVLNFFDVPQKTVKVSIDGIESKISLAEINYFYFQVWSQRFSTAMQYEQYGEGMGLSMTGFDYTKSPDSQEYKEDHVQFTGVTMEDLGNIKNPTWQDVFTYSAVYQLVNAKYGAEKAKEAGLKVGAYAYVAPIPGVDPKKHAEFVLDVLKGKSFEYPIYIDVESWKHYDKFGRTIYVHEFLQEIEKHNAFVGVYGSDISTFKDMLSLDLKGENMQPIMKHYTWWVARYGSKPQYATKNMHIWQFSSKGKVPGITGNVDLNECYQDFSVIERKGMNRF